MDVLFWIGRILFASLFIFSGLGHFMQVDAMSQYAKSKGVPAPRAAVLLTGLVIVLGGLSVLLWIRVDVGSWLLVVFLLATAFKMHDFWAIPDPGERAGQQAQFLKNVALAGAAIMFYVLDARLSGPGIG